MRAINLEHWNIPGNIPTRAEIATRHVRRALSGVEEPSLAVEVVVDSEASIGCRAESLQLVNEDHGVGAAVGVDEPDRRFNERFVLPEPAPTDLAGLSTRSVVIRLDRRETSVRYESGDTILDTARRGGLRPPFSCEQGNCATCMARLDAGRLARGHHRGACA